MRYTIYSAHLGEETDEENREAADRYVEALKERFGEKGTTVDIIVKHGVSGAGTGAMSHDSDYDAEETVNEIAREVWERMAM